LLDLEHFGLTDTDLDKKENLTKSPYLFLAM